MRVPGVGVGGHKGLLGLSLWAAFAGCVVVQKRGTCVHEPCWRNLLCCTVGVHSSGLPNIPGSCY
jgi:hypothetical protein